MILPGSRGFLDSTVCIISEGSDRPGTTVPRWSRVGTCKTIDLGTEYEVRQYEEVLILVDAILLLTTIFLP